MAALRWIASLRSAFPGFGRRSLRLQLQALSGFCVVQSRTFGNTCVFEKRQQLGQALGPPLFEIDVLGMRDLQRWSVGGEPQGNDKTVFLDALGSFDCDGDLVPYTLLLKAAECCNE